MSFIESPIDHGEAYYTLLGVGVEVPGSTWILIRTYTVHVLHAVTYLIAMILIVISIIVADIMIL